MREDIIIQESRSYIEVFKLKLQELDDIMLPVIREISEPIYDEQGNEISEENLNFIDYVKYFENYLDLMDREWGLSDTEFFQKIKRNILLYKNMMHYYEKKDLILNTFIKKIEENIGMESKVFEKSETTEKEAREDIEKAVQRIKMGEYKKGYNVILAFAQAFQKLKKKNYPEEELDEFKKYANSLLEKENLKTVFNINKKKEEEAPW